MQRLKPGDIVTSIGPFGDFHIKPTQNEMIYLGGGSGMAPLRSHISHLLETVNSGRQISFWYGARTAQEIFYREYFEALAGKFPNFTCHLALSEPLPEDNWTSSTGLIHDVLFQEYLSKHSSPATAEYYLCGPPGMVQSAKKMLEDLKVPACQIAFDEF
jgi:Na+-transporting NADH:ubiquinone oxidoreductase subunit F